MSTDTIEVKLATEPLLSSNSLEVIRFILNIEEVQRLLDKNVCTIPKEQLTKLLKVISALSVETQKVIPLNTIIDCVGDVFKDGKLEMHEIPLLIKMLSENVSKQNISNINVSDFSLLLKLLIIVLLELNILKVNSTDLTIINALIDTSLELLSIPVKVKLNKCFVFRC